jgi:NADP-dependent aldehyde dehydrogenase
VVVKAHPGHMATAELTAEAIVRAVVRCGLPGGVFNMIFGTDIGAELVRHPAIQAVGFTGSLAGGGKALYQLAQQRPQPIPLFAEMSAINPLIIPQALQTRAEARKRAGGVIHPRRRPVLYPSGADSGAARRRAGTL